MEDVTAWALAARDGDQVAAAAFVRHTQRDVWRLCAALIDPASADDLAQEVYLRCFRGIAAFEGRSSARTWLLGITRRCCADHIRGLRRRRRLDETLRAQATDLTAPDPVGGAAARDLLGRLAIDRRAALVLTQIVGLSYEEAAAVEGVPVGTIRSRVARARSDLMAALVN